MYNSTTLPPLSSTNHKCISIMVAEDSQTAVPPAFADYVQTAGSPFLQSSVHSNVPLSKYTRYDDRYTKVKHMRTKV
jgi:hypothetical protein